MLSSARFGTLLVGASLLATPVSAAEPPKQLQGKLSWALHRIAWEEEQGQRLTAQGRRFVDGEQGLVSAVVVLAPGSAPEAIADAVASEGGRVVAVARRPGWVEVRVPPRALRPLSRHPAVARLRAPRYPVRQVVSQGVTTIKAEGLRVRLGADGTGVTVAVLDGGFGGFHDLQGGELPASTELTDAASRLLGDDDDPHGAACAEVVHDVAPGARLILAGFDTDVDWFVALEDLLGRDVQVISHSWGFSNAYPPDGQNPFAGMVNQVASRGVLFVTSAGNEAESFFQGGAVDADDNGFVEFSPGTELLPITLSDEDNDVVLRWDDPYEASDHDYDLFVVTGEFASNPSLDDNPAILASSRDEQDGEGSEPLEWATVELEGRRDLFVAVWRDPARPMRPDQRLFVWSAGKVGEGFRTSTGTLTAPADARGALTVAAVRFDATAVESFSSRGPTADGRAKPDIAGPDGVATATYEDPFFGTSAAAPHVAGAAALLLSAHPGLHPTDLRLMLEQATTTLGRTSGKRNDLGYGLIDLDRTPVAGPMISPDRFLVGQAPFDGLPPYGDGDVGPVGFLRVPTTRAGDLDVALDWASPENDLDMIVFAGSCELVDLGGGACPALAGAETSFKPEKIVVREAAAGGYTVLLVNRGATAESGTLSVSLTPGTPSAAAFTTPVRIERGLLRRR